MSRQVIEARFIDNERKHLEIEWKNEEKDEAGNVLNVEQYFEIIEAVGGDPIYEEVLQQVDLDTIHESTWQYVKQQRKGFEQIVKDIAIAEGIYEEKIYENRQQILLDIIKDDPSKEDQDELFKFKLGVFELEYIRDSKNRELKGELRKADTIFKVLKILIQFKDEAASIE
jgi:hypothetical protein